MLLAESTSDADDEKKYSSINVKNKKENDSNISVNTVYLDKILNSSELKQYRSVLIANGYSSEEAILNLTLDDLAEMNIKKGYQILIINRIKVNLCLILCVFLDYVLIGHICTDNI